MRSSSIVMRRADVIWQPGQDGEGTAIVLKMEEGN